MSLFNPLVSIIIPCYNVELYIVECLDSVFHQTYPNIEVICVDNNSTDKTSQLINEYKESSESKLQLLFEKKKGASVARNKGLSVAKGDWVQFLDADDLLDPQKIEHQLLLTKSNKQTDFVVGSFYKLATSGNKKHIIIQNNDAFKALFVSNLGITSSNLFYKKSIMNVGGWDENLKSSQEASLMFKLLAADAVVAFDDEPLTIIRERAEGQISQQNPNSNWMQYVNLRLEIIMFLKNNKASYFETEKEFYFSNLFKQIRRIAKFDLETADQIFNAYFPKHFKPQIGIVYAICFKLMGFKFTEQLLHKSLR
jgi:glycosyltransferase involved in cell wall biosynthesis